MTLAELRALCDSAKEGGHATALLPLDAAYALIDVAAGGQRLYNETDEWTAKEEPLFDALKALDAALAAQESSNG